MAASIPASPERTVAGDFAAVFALLQPHMARLDAYIRGQLDGFEPEIRAMAVDQKHAACADRYTLR